MTIESGAKLSSDEERVIEHYFASYEYAISINKCLRGEGPIDERYASVVGKESQVILRAIETRGLVLDKDVVVYRAMSQEFDGTPAAKKLSRKVPAGAPLKCLMSAAGQVEAARFGSNRFVYHIAVPRGERCVRRLTRSIGVGEWYEYLFGPGSIVYYGNYTGVPDQAVPVAYVSATTPAETEFERLLRLVGMRDFTAPVVETLPVVPAADTLPRPVPLTLPSGERIPLLLNNSPEGRFMIFHWGVEQTFGDETIRIFDIRRGAKL